MAENPLMQVMTIREVAERWHYHHRYVRASIFTRHKPLVARMSGGTWLIDVSSVIARWGNPPERSPESA